MFIVDKLAQYSGKFKFKTLSKEGEVEMKYHFIYRVHIKKTNFQFKIERNDFYKRRFYKSKPNTKSDLTQQSLIRSQSLDSTMIKFQFCCPIGVLSAKFQMKGSKIKIAKRIQG